MLNDIAGHGYIPSIRPGLLEVILKHDQNFEEVISSKHWHRITSHLLRTKCFNNILLEMKYIINKQVLDKPLSNVPSPSAEFFLSIFSLQLITALHIQKYRVSMKKLLHLVLRCIWWNAVVHCRKRWSQDSVLKWKEYISWYGVDSGHYTGPTCLL